MVIFIKCSGLQSNFPFNLNNVDCFYLKKKNNNNNIAECFHLYFSSNTGKRLQVNEVHL